MGYVRTICVTGFSAETSAFGRKPERRRTPETSWFAQVT